MLSLFTATALEEAEPLLWDQRPILFYVPSGTLGLVLNGRSLSLPTGGLHYCPPLTFLELTSVMGRAYALRLETEACAALGLHPEEQHIVCSSAESTHPPCEQRLLALVSQLLAEPEGLRRLQLEVSVLTSLCTEFTAGGAELQKQPESGEEELIRRSLAFLSAHYREPIGVQELADACHITQTYLARLYKKHLPYTPSELLTELRLLEAERLLQRTALPLQQVAEQCGFASARSLHTFFLRKFQMSPAQFRQQPAENAEKPAPIPMRAAEEETLRRTVALSADAALPGKSPFRLLNIGKLSYLGSSDFYRRVQQFRQQYQLEYAFVSGLTDDDVLRGIRTPEGIVWDYSLLDANLERVLAAGLTPILFLLGVPGMLAEGTQKFYVTNTALPQDFSGVVAFYRDFFLHLREKFGEQPNTWLCTIWHIPDAPRPGEQEQITALYAALHAVLRSVCPGMRIGAPHQRLPLQPEKTFHDFADFCAKNDCKPDYFCFSAALEIPEQTVSAADGIDTHCRSDVPAAVACARACRQALSRLFGEKPMLLASQALYENRNPLNDTRFASAGLAAYFSGTDGLFALAAPHLLPVQPPGTGLQGAEFRSSPGLFTDSGIPKASAHAFAFVKLLEGPVRHAEPWLCITGGGRHTCVLLQNPVPVSYRVRQAAAPPDANPFYLSDGKTFLCTDSNAAFWPDASDGPQLSVSLTLQGLPDGVYILEERCITASHGSAYDYWLHGGRPECLTPEERQALSAISIPLRQKKQVVLRGGTLTLERRLEPNETHLFLLTAQEP